MLPERLKILDLYVTPFASAQHAAKCVIDRVSHGQKTACFAINPEKILHAEKDAQLRETLKAAEMTLCDGIGISIASLLLYGKLLHRCTGVDLFAALVREANEAGVKIFLLGASAESNEGTYKNLRKMYPNLQIVGRRDGYFKDPEEVVAQINSCSPDLLFVAMGSPLQEQWIAEYFGKVSATFCMGLGGTFDVFSGATKRAPAIFRKTGTEFIFRQLYNPSWTYSTRIKKGLAPPVFFGKLLKRKLLDSHTEQS